MSKKVLGAQEAAAALGVPIKVITYWLGQVPYPAEQDDDGHWQFTAEARQVLDMVKSLREQDHGLDTIRRRIGVTEDPFLGQRPGSPPPPPTAADRQIEEARRRAPRPQATPPAGARPVPAPRPPAQPPRTPRPPAPTDEAGARASSRPTVADPRQAQAPPPAARPARPHEDPPNVRPTAVEVTARPLPAERSEWGLTADVSRAVAEAVRGETDLAEKFARAAHHIGKLEAENGHLRSLLAAANACHAQELLAARKQLGAAPPSAPKSAPIRAAAVAAGIATAHSASDEGRPWLGSGWVIALGAMALVIFCGVAGAVYHDPDLPVLLSPAATERDEPGHADPVRPEPARIESITSEPVKSEPVRSEPVKSEPVRSEPVRSEPVKSETVRSEPVKSEAALAPAPAPEGRVLEGRIPPEGRIPEPPIAREP